ncbi:amidase family protein [Bradyrhizobium erythrophlei]|uniref:amidase family protein n=1 Tax=Bradyrhizobium erythrophlei TaxID=1437360 RepID=UPI0035EA91F0
MKRELLAILLLSMVCGAAYAAPFNIEEASIATIQKAIKSEQITCKALVTKYLDRINAYDQKGPALNTTIAINPAALDIAARMDADFKRTGKLVGPLHCVPVAAKDNYNTIDMPTTGGNLLLKDVKPTVESTVTRKLREAGAIILMKTNMHEFALSGTTVSSLGGQTKNPYDLTRTPGGSSGGTGAAVASNFAAVGLGSDTVNSIRSPASANSLVGFRSTKGLISRAGVMPTSTTQDVVGPITRSVADAAVMLDLIAGYDPGDAATARSIGKIPKSFSTSLDPKGLFGVRIGVLKNFIGAEPLHEEVNVALRNALSALEQAGATIVEIDDSFFSTDAFNRDYDVQKWEFKTQFDGYLKGLGDKAPVKNLNELIVSGKYHKPSLEKFLVATDALEAPAQENEYLSRLSMIDGLRDHLLGRMAQQKVDVVVYPEQKRLVVPIGELNQADRTGILAALTGFPAVTVPMGFSKPSSTAPIGVPIGLDILGRPFTEALLFKVAYGFEQATKVRKPPQSVPALRQ